MTYGRIPGTKFISITATEAVELHYRGTFMLDYSPSDAIVWTDRRRLKRQRRRHQL